MSGDKENVTNEVESASAKTTTQNTDAAHETSILSKCSAAKKVAENTDVVDAAAGAATSAKPAFKNGDLAATITDADAEKMNEMFTDDMIADMKQDLKQNGAAENRDEFTDQCDQQESAALEMKMKNSEKTEALQLFQQGKRNLLIKDFDAAVETLASACERYSSIYGELSAECGDVYMTYGHALIELWRYGEANKKEGDEPSEANKPLKSDIIVEEKEGETETNGNVEATTETTETAAAAEETSQNEDEAEAEEAEAETEAKETTENEKSNADEDGEDAAVAQPNKDDTIEDESVDENDDDDDDEEDVDNLQLAWEIFETAKNIYTKHNDDQNVAKVYTKLGEISIASGNYELAIEDLKKSLEVLDKCILAKPRQIADSHFQLYSAYSANYNFYNAEIELRNAKNILEDQLQILDRKLKKLAADSDEAKQINSEMKDLQELTKDMNTKLSELSTSKRQVVSAISTTIINKMENNQSNQKASSSAGASAASSLAASSSDFSPLKSSNVPVNNISHLVRKKPKAEVDEEKKSPQKENVTNGTTDKTNGCTEVKAVTASPVSNGEGQTCKRKADDDAEAESNAKKLCVTPE